MRLPPARFHPDHLRGPLAGVAGSLAAALVFASLHAVLIVPIWQHVPSAMVFTGVVGAGAGLAFAEIHGSSRLATHSPRDGARFGALLWLAVVPVTLVDALLRTTGVAPRYELFAVTVAVVLAIGRSSRAFGIWLAVLPACVVAGLVMVGMLAIIARVGTAAPRSLSSRSEAGSA